ncbi:hypothetical protein CU098_008753 [Rhizopus stolonifer]|uniref:Uncharacterized protein n=1 Tax=Rhizopus stolonifer TaxID=4846 RepID=A0A367KJ92_RHIST|nr:hypothetical protein CU098_008753 [Rhizopus stolonifer]
MTRKNIQTAEAWDTTASFGWKFQRIMAFVTFVEALELAFETCNRRLLLKDQQLTFVYGDDSAKDVSIEQEEQEEQEEQQIAIKRKKDDNGLRKKKVRRVQNNGKNLVKRKAGYSDKVLLEDSRKIDSLIHAIQNKTTTVLENTNFEHNTLELSMQSVDSIICQYKRMTKKGLVDRYFKHLLACSLWSIFVEYESKSKWRLSQRYFLKVNEVPEARIKVGHETLGLGQKLDVVTKYLGGRFRWLQWKCLLYLSQSLD